MRLKSLNGNSVSLGNDLLARILAVLLSGIAMVWGSWNSQDRFTGSEGRVLQEKVRQLENRVDKLPPSHLLDDLRRIEDRLKELERASQG